MTAVQIIPERLAQLPAISLKRGFHINIANGMCAMEAASWLAGEEWSDEPKCVCPVIGAFMRSWNDALQEEDRNRLIKDLVPITVGTADSALELRRSLMAADWLVRVHTPAWLRLAGFTQQADMFTDLSEITSMAQVSSFQGALEAVRSDVAVAEVVQGGDKKSAPWEAAVGAACNAAQVAAWDDAWGVARFAAIYAAWSVSRSGLAEKKRELQLSAVDLVKRMCALTEDDVNVAA